MVELASGAGVGRSGSLISPTVREIRVGSFLCGKWRSKKTLEILEGIGLPCCLWRLIRGRIWSALGAGLSNVPCGFVDEAARALSPYPTPFLNLSALFPNVNQGE